MKKNMPEFMQEIQDKIHRSQTKVQALDLNSLESTDLPFFIPVHQLIPGQCRFSFQRMLQKWRDYRGDISLEEPFHAVLTSWGPILLDGHHQFLVHVYEGHNYFPIKIVEDYTHVEKDKVITLLTEMNKIFYKGPRVPLAFHQMEDAPNRYLASLLAYRPNKVGSTLTGKVWVKRQDSPPFVEFVIGDLLHRHGINYKEAWGFVVPEVVQLMAKKVLWVEKSQDHPLLKRVSLIGEFTSEMSNVRPLLEISMHDKPCHIGKAVGDDLVLLS